MQEVIASDEYDCVPREEFPARFVDSKKVPTLRESFLLGQCLGSRSGNCGDLHRRAPRLHGEALATLPAATREHRLPVFGPHPDEEAVRALAAAIVRLKRALHV